MQSPSQSSINTLVELTNNRLPLAPVLLGDRRRKEHERSTAHFKVNTMDWCRVTGRMLWAALTFPIGLPLVCLLLLFATLCGLTGEFMLWLLPVKTFPKGLVDTGNHLVSVAKKILDWCLQTTQSTEHKGDQETALKNANATINQATATIQPTITENGEVIFGFPKIGFTYEELIAASNYFAHDNFIGKGGFGSVHKGRLEDGREIAIKQLSVDGTLAARDFIVEVDVLSRVHHRHLVQLLGCCITQEKRMLVCEYVPNETLEFHLHKSHESSLDWPTRMKIALGSAKALSYLHEDCQPRIIHRDIKAANILLDNSFEVKVADFGLAKIFPDDETHIYATQLVGTRGYLAPELSIGEIREKSDTYSYGVVLLELITGKRPLVHTDSSKECLADWVKPLLLKAVSTGNYDEIVDPRLINNYSIEEMKLMIDCAFACIRSSPQARPPMSQVVLVLEGITTSDTLGDEPIQSSGNLFSTDSSGTTSSVSEHNGTESARNLQFSGETEYMTACLDFNFAGTVTDSTGDSFGKTISASNQSAYFDCLDVISEEETPLRRATTRLLHA